MIEQAQAFAGTRSKFVETRQAIEQKSAKTSALIDVEASTTRAAYKGLHAANRYRSIQHPRSARVDCPLAAKSMSILDGVHRQRTLLCTPARKQARKARLPSTRA